MNINLVDYKVLEVSEIIRNIKYGAIIKLLDSNWDKENSTLITENLIGFSDFFDDCLIRNTSWGYIIDGWNLIIKHNDVLKAYIQMDYDNFN